jgi:hypothetical protein
MNESPETDTRSTEIFGSPSHNRAEPESSNLDEPTEFGWSLSLQESSFAPGRTEQERRHHHAQETYWFLLGSSRSMLCHGTCG